MAKGDRYQVVPLDESDVVLRPVVWDTVTGEIDKSWCLTDWDRAERHAEELNKIEMEMRLCPQP